MLSATKISDVAVFISILFFAFFAIFDPSNQIFGLKEVSFVLMFSTMILFNKCCFVAWPSAFLLYIVFMVTYGAFVAFAFEYEVEDHYPVAFAKAFLFLIVMLVGSYQDFKAPFMCLMKALSCFTVFVFLVNVLGGIGPISPELMLAFTSWLTFDVEAAKIGERTFGALTTPMIFYKSSPLLAIAIGISLQEKRYGLSGLLCFALLLSGTRANMAIAIILLMLHLFFSLRISGKIISSGFLAVVLIGLSPFVVENFLDPQETSNQVKAAHVVSYIDFFNDNPFVLLTGSGIGAIFFSSGFSAYVFQTELVYLDMVRYLGLIVFSGFLVFLIAPAVVLFRSGFKDYSFGYAAYLMISATNPLLVSSTGMLALTMAYVLAFVRQPARRAYKLRAVL